VCADRQAKEIERDEIEHRKPRRVGDKARRAFDEVAHREKRNGASRMLSALDLFRYRACFKHTVGEYRVQKRRFSDSRRSRERERLLSVRQDEVAKRVNAIVFLTRRDKNGNARLFVYFFVFLRRLAVKIRFRYGDNGVYLL
jgi:hypothetical protein